MNFFIFSMTFLPKVMEKMKRRKFLLRVSSCSIQIRYRRRTGCVSDRIQILWMVHNRASIDMLLANLQMNGPQYLRFVCSAVLTMPTSSHLSMVGLSLLASGQWSITNFTSSFNS